jgi:hypothetical protein
VTTSLNSSASAISSTWHEAPVSNSIGDFDVPHNANVVAAHGMMTA